mmetsp:Transcript_16583/g.26807  ORF Transcript_16583/g.26807 Transcript_16583/m.26807 type:complete len:232 (+) Transcript_16583:130-825(+)
MIKILSKVREEVDAGKLRIILASASPRRRELLGDIILGHSVPFAVQASKFKEDYDKALYKGRAHEYVAEYALQKALDVRREVIAEQSSDSVTTIIIGCDTVVVRDGTILEKPASSQEAFDTILSYSKRDVSVVSGMALILVKPNDSAQDDASDKHVSTCETCVTFAELDEDLVKAYVNTGEPMDKAGGFGIQGLGAVLISGIKGCYFNVVGLPVQMLSNNMCEFLTRNSFA